MKTRNTKDKLSLLQLTVFLLLFLIIPSPIGEKSITPDLAFFITVWVGIFGTNAFGFSTTDGSVQTFSNCFLVFLAMTDLSATSVLVYGCAVFPGILLYALRERYTYRNALNKALKQAVTGIVVLWAVASLQNHLPQSTNPGYTELFFHAFLLLVAAGFFDFLTAGIADFTSDVFKFRIIRRSVISLSISLLAMPLLLPTISVFHSSISADGILIWNSNIFTLGNYCLLTAQIAAFLLARSSRSFSLAMAAETSLAEMSRNIATSEGPLDILGNLTGKCFKTAVPDCVRATWRETSFSMPSSEPPSSKPEFSRSGCNGLRLDIWTRAKNSLDTVRIESFITQADTALENMRLRKQVSEEAWSCMETIVQSMERTDRGQAGRSRRIAAAALAVGKAMKLQPRFLEHLRITALLRNAASVLLQNTDTTDSYREFGAFSGQETLRLPGEIAEAITHIGEHYDGSGKPNGLDGNEIPLISRILSVVSSYVISTEQIPVEKTLIDIEQRSGTLYDPYVISALKTSIEKGYIVTKV